MPNPFDDIIPEQQAKKNPFDDLLPEQPGQSKPNPFDDLAGPRLVELSQDQTALWQRAKEPEPGLDEWGLPTAPVVDAYLGRITANRDKAANILAMSQMYGLAPSIVNDRYDDLNTLKDQPEAYRFLPQLAIAGGMLAAPIAATVRGAQATIPLWKYLLGFGAFAAEEEANAFVRSRIQGTPFAETRPYSLVDLASVDSDEALKTVLAVTDIFAKGAAIHSTYKGLKPLWEHAARQTMEASGIPRRVYVDANLASDVMRGTATEEQLAMWRDLGITADELRAAKHGAFQLEIPAEKLITIADKPWYAKLKGLFRVSPYEDTMAEPGGPRKVTPIGGLLEEPGKGKPTGPEVKPEAPTPPPVIIPEAYQDMVLKIANAAGVDTGLVARVVRAESNWSPAATSPAGAKGLMQLMPGTARDMGVIDPTDPYDNLKGGTKYLALMLKRYGGDETRALVAYNWGPRNADAWDGNPETLPKETQEYLVRVQGGEPGKARKVAPRPSMVDLGRGLTTESLMDDLARGRLDFSLSSVLPWDERFPSATIHTNAKKLMSHPDHAAAKAGDPDAAQRIVDDLINLDRVANLAENYPNAKLVHVHAEEASGRNKLPAAYAKTISNLTGMEIDDQIVSVSRAKHTGKDSLTRILFRARFEGEIEPDREYILVDDMITMGGTLSELRHYIENKGGKVVAATSLAYSRWGPVLGLRRSTLDSLIERFGRENLTGFIREHGIAGIPEALSDGEGRYLLSFKSLDTLRDRIAKARQEGHFSLSGRQKQALEEGIGQPNADPNNQIGQDQLLFQPTAERLRGIEESLVAELGESLRGNIAAPRGVPGAEHARAAEIAQSLGLEPVFFEITDPVWNTVTGFFEHDKPAVIYLNTASPAPPEFVAVHEGTHSLAVRDRERYDQFVDDVYEHLVPGSFERYDRWLDAQRAALGLERLTANAVHDELMADLAAELVSGVDHVLGMASMVDDTEVARGLVLGALGAASPGSAGGEKISFALGPQTYDDLMNEASRRAHAVIEERMAKERKRLESRLRREAEAMVDDDPLQQTIKAVVAQRGFSPAHLRKLGYGEDMISNLRSVHRGLVSRNGTARADEIAMDTGLWEGSDALLEAIINSAPRREEVERIARGLAEEHRTQREINAADTYAELLNEEIKILSELTKGSTDAWANKPTPGIQRTIDDLTGVKRISETEMVTEHDALKAAMKKAQTAARQAYTAGKRGGALAAKLKEREIFQHYRTQLEAKRVVARLAKALRKAVRIPANELKPGGIKPEYRDVIHSILAPYYRELKFNPSNPSGMTHAQFLQHMDDSGELTIHDPDRINAFTRKPWKDLTINELREIKGAIGEIVYLGKREGKLILAGKKQNLDNLVRSLAKTIYATTGKRGVNLPPSPQEVLEARDRGEKTTSRLLERYTMSRRKVEFLCRDLDGWVENGPVHQALFQPLANAEAKQITMTQEKAAELETLFKSFSARIGGKKLSKWLNEKVVVPGTGKVFSRHRLMMVYLNSGNEGNLRALRSIFPQDQIDLINASFTPEELQLFNDLHKLVDSLFKPLAVVYRAMTGQRLKKVEGRYWPIVLDKDMSMKAEEIKANESQKDLFANVFTAPTMKHGFEIERKGTSLPPKLDLSVLFEHLEQVVHRVTHAEPVRNAQKIITHPDFKGAVIATRGRAFHDQFMPWLQYVANPRKDTSISVWDRGADVLRRNATVNLLGYSLTTVMRSLFDWTVVVPELGFTDTLSGFYSYLKAPRETMAFVNSLSPEMTNFKNSFDRELGAMYERIIPTMNPVKRRIMESAFAWLGMVESVNRYPVWLEAYLQATEGRGWWKGKPLQPEEAARWADQLVRRVKAQAAPKDMAEITRGRGMQKLMTMFYTEASKVDNLLTEYWLRVRHDPRYSYFDYARALFWILVVGPILTETLIRRRPPKDPKEVGADVAGFYFGRFPFIRDVATAILTGFGYTPTPAVRGAESVTSAVRGGWNAMFGDKKVSGERALGIAVSAADAAALLNPLPWGGLPTRQMITFLKGLADLQAGRAKTPAALIDRQAEKKRKQDLKAGIR